MTNKSSWNVISFGVCLPRPILKELEIMRGDVSRSRYIQRLIEKNMNAIPQIRPQVGPLDESAVSRDHRVGLPNG